MNSTNAMLDADETWTEEVDSSGEAAQAPEAPARPAAILRGTARGLEVHLDGAATPDAIAAAMIERLDEAPAFFRGSNVRVRVSDGPLAAGCLGRLDAIAEQFELRIVEIAAVKAQATVVEEDGVPEPNLAAGSAPSPAFEDEAPTGSALPTYQAALMAQEGGWALHAEPVNLPAEALKELEELVTGEPVSFEEPTQTSVPIALAATAEIELETRSAGPRLVVGPVRSGVILEHRGHVIVFGDVNPGAEVRAEGNIIVLGRLRGTAHAGIGQEVGFILALRLEPQQLRIGRMVARAADSDVPGTEAELAYGTGDTIVVEQYLGKLPRNLATSL